MEKEGLEKTFGHAVKFPGLIKMSSFQENAFGTAWKDCIRTHLNVIQISLNQENIFGESKNVRNFCGDRESDERKYGQSLRTKLEAGKRHVIICKCVMGDSKLLEYNLYSSLKYWENMF